MKRISLYMLFLATVVFSACSPDKDFVFEYTPEAEGDNSWTAIPEPEPEPVVPDDDVVPGKAPSDPSLAGTLVSRLSPVYVGSLTVQINETVTPPSTQSVIIRAVDGNHINFALKNFQLIDEENVMPVGTILIPNIEVVDDKNGNLSFSFDDSINILAGDKEIMMGDELIEMGEEDWLGPFLGPIPITIKGISNGKNMNIGIDIVMEGLGQTIHVDFITE